MRSKKYNESIDDFDTLIELVPTHKAAYNNRGLAKIKLGDKDEACKDFNYSYELGNKTSSKYNIDRYCNEITNTIFTQIELEKIGSGSQIHMGDGYVQHHKSNDIDLQIGGVLQYEGIARFSVVSSSIDLYSIDRLYIKLHGYSDCKKRNEKWEIHGFKQIQAYKIYISPFHSEYDLIPQEPLGEFNQWSYEGIDYDEFFVQFVFDPYILYLISIELQGRNILTGETINRSSTIYPLIRVENGNDGGCLDLERWYKQKNLQAPIESKYNEGINTITYQLLTANLDKKSSYLDKFSIDQLSTVLEDAKSIIRARPENEVFSENISLLSKRLKGKE